MSAAVLTTSTPRATSATGMAPADVAHTTTSARAPAMMCGAATIAGASPAALGSNARPHSSSPFTADTAATNSAMAPPAGAVSSTLADSLRAPPEYTPRTTTAASPLAAD